MAEIVGKFDAVACDMESGAIGQIAYLAGVPYVAIRIISDGAGDDASLSFSEVCEKASYLLHDTVVEALGKL